MMRRELSFALLALACGNSAPPAQTYASHSSSLALSSDGTKLYVANPDADSVAIIDVASRTLEDEVLLAGAHPTPDATGAYTPAVMPRSVALSPDGRSLFVTGQRSGKLYAIDLASKKPSSVSVCSEPFGVVATAGEVFVSCSQDDAVVRVSASGLSVDAKVAVATEPWALALSADGTRVFVTHFLGASVTTIDAASMTVLETQAIAEVAPRGDKRLAHGQVRGLYDAAVVPHGDELWIVHQLLATDTAQPDLDFESTVFPAISTTGGQTISTNAQDVPGINGAFADIVSAPRALAFTHDGAFALVADLSSDDVLVVDVNAQVEAGLVRPLPGHQPEGIVLSTDDTLAFVHQRNTSDVVVLDLSRAQGGLDVTVEEKTIPTITSDPMPASLRFGQHLFYSANSDEYPITRNHWVACATCHMEGRSDAVTWRFEQGPRDTPSNAGGMLGTGFLFRTADRVAVQDYWRTINIEQGGAFDPDDTTLKPVLDAIASYVNLAIPLPMPPTTDAALVAKGAAIFQNAGCASCHTGSRYTDSGSGNAGLDLGGAVLLHDVGTCVTSGAFLDAAHDDIAGHTREACAFDTPSLNGLASTPPYMHDGSAKTVKDAVDRMLAPSNAQGMSADDEAALVEFLRSL